MNAINMNNNTTFARIDGQFVDTSNPAALVQALTAAGIDQAPLYRGGVWIEWDVIRHRDGNIYFAPARDWPDSN